MKETEDQKRRRAEINARVISQIPRRGKETFESPGMPPLPDQYGGLTPIDTEQLALWMTAVAKFAAAQHLRINNLELRDFTNKVILGVFGAVLLVLLYAR